ncbi:hypothetical protein ABIC15_000869 [Exiguobacterium sp. PvP048]|uniref:McrB family protein n=1 Tax=unclassified Exiguobacterium TaxID=2644629 RepID=UPI003398E483
MTIPTNSSTDFFENWVEDNSNFLNELHNPTTEDTKSFYERFKNSGVFGESLTVSTIKETMLSNDPKRKIVRMLVMKPTPNGYVPCPHPIDTNRSWEISSICPSTLDVTDSIYYTCSYTHMRNTRTLNELLTFIPNSLTPVTLNLPDRLRLVGGNTLVQAAEDAFGTDISTVVVEQVLRLKEEEIAASLESLDTERKQHESEKKELESELQQIQEKFNETKNRLSEKTKELTREENRLLELLTEVRLSEVLDEENVPLLPFEQENILPTLQSLFYHNNESALLYPLDKIELFLRAIQTNLLLILNGPSGTGKSSLVHAFASAFKGAKATIVPVQSSWTDKQDLLGYFSPSERRYVETPFLRALLDAKETDGLHLICLDEMNLSHVEYYFAEFLSLREQKNPTVPLYPFHYFKEAKDFCLTYESMSETTYVEDIRYRDALALISYPSKLAIPDNVRFIGTLNMDHTVKPLSPKVIDRSLLLELDHVALDEETIERIKSLPLTGRLDAPLSLLTTPSNQVEEVEEYADLIIDLSKGLDSIPDARINARGRQQMIRYLQYSNLNEQTLDLLLQAKLLPRLHFSTRNEAAMNAFNAFLRTISKYPDTLRRLEHMKDDGRYINFFK